MKTYQCKNLKPEVILIKLGFKKEDIGWTRKADGFFRRYHCKVNGTEITAIHKDFSLLSRGRILKQHKGEDSPLMYYAIEFMDDRHLAASKNDLLKRIELPSCIMRISKRVKKLLRK